jgi:hypothetical protein
MKKTTLVEHKLSPKELRELNGDPPAASGAHRQVAGPRSDFRASHPKQAALENEQLRKALEHAAAFYTGMKPALQQMVTSAEQARMAGIYFSEFIETSLPGKKLTLDLYQQDKHLYLDKQTGLRISFEQVNWFVSIARRRANEPFLLVGDVLGEAKQLAFACGELGLDTKRAEQTAHVPPAPTDRLKQLFGDDLAATIAQLRGNANYCPNGRLRPDLAAVLAEDLKPKLVAWDEGRAWLRTELGI